MCRIYCTGVKCNKRYCQRPGKAFRDADCPDTCSRKLPSHLVKTLLPGGAYCRGCAKGDPIDRILLTDLNGSLREFVRDNDWRPSQTDPSAALSCSFQQRYPPSRSATDADLAAYTTNTGYEDAPISKFQYFIPQANRNTMAQTRKRISSKPDTILVKQQLQPKKAIVLKQSEPSTPSVKIISLNEEPLPSYLEELFNESQTPSNAYGSEIEKKEKTTSAAPGSRTLPFSDAELTLLAENFLDLLEEELTRHVDSWLSVT
ncbi:hypothetical protein M422DRAFT_27556 [Sphaerobolus stellatus SS14]|nr:hypothetical protein M422DRAFT_27556 [Sphaerobolus stellatus SS14]